MSDVKAETRVARVVLIVDPGYTREPLEVVVNRGASHGLKLGDRYLIFGTGPHINDPETGEDLGTLELVRGRGEVVHVQEKMATIRSTERRRTRPAKRIIREQSWATNLLSRAGAPSGVIEEEIAPETEVPFESVQLGDFAKPI
ncbi:MAG: hypothetical protein JWQ55_1017 [Rhodopila sp.]|jgi:hypothetical protein|nr:hypothetical protein [Rhodopila sp.]